MIDKNKIFGLFGNEENGISNPVSGMTQKIFSDPYTKLGMFTKLIINHHKAIIEFYGKPLGIKNARKHLGWYLDGLTNSQTLRNRLLRSLNTDEISLLK